MTGGRGMTEVQRAQWLLSMPACADVNSAMQNLTGVGFHTSEQHKETSNSRKKRDKMDTLKILSFLQERNPFSEDISLRNIETGVTADASVNVDKAKEIGTKIIESMAGKNIVDFTFKKSNQAITLNAKSNVKVGGETIQVDPQLLFQRLTTVANGLLEDTSEIFKYELCSFPPSIFDSSGFPREAHKPALADSIWNVGKCSVCFRRRVTPTANSLAEKHFILIHL